MGVLSEIFGLLCSGKELLTEVCIITEFISNYFNKYPAFQSIST